MTKKRTVVDASDVQEPTPQPSSVAEDATGEGDAQWEAYRWNEMDGLRCKWCEWDTLEGMGAAQEHMRQCPRCAPAVEMPKPSPILIADRYGNIINGGSLVEPTE